MSVNKVFILGHVGKDPNIKHFENNSVANFSMATSEKYKDRNGTLQERTDWHNIVVNGKMAKVVEDYVKKGTQMMVEGKIRTRKYEVNGQDRYITEIYAERFELLGRPQNSSESKINTPQDTHLMDSGNEPDMDSYQEQTDDLPF